MKRILILFMLLLSLGVHAGGMYILPSAPEPVITPALPYLKALGPAAREAAANQNEYQKLLTKDLDSKVMQIIQGTSLPAPAADPSLCREKTHRNPAASSSGGRFRGTAEAVGRGMPFWQRWAPSIPTPADLCIPKAAMESSRDYFHAQFKGFSDALIGILKTDPGPMPTYKYTWTCFDSSQCAAHMTLLETNTAVAKTYMVGLLTTYLEGALLCGQKNLLDPEIDLNTLISQLPCLSDAEVARLSNAVAKALKTTMAIIEATQPDYAEAVRRQLLKESIALLIPLFDRTKSEKGPLFGILKAYQSRLEAGSQSSTSLVPLGKGGVQTLIKITPDSFSLYNPSTKAMQDVPICATPEIDTASLYANEVFYNSKKANALGALLQDQLSNYEQYLQLGGVKTIYGAPIEGLKEIGPWQPKAPDLVKLNAKLQVNSECLYFPNFIKVLLHPMLIGDGTCPAWDTALQGKMCLYQDIEIKLSGTAPSLQTFANHVHDVLISTAHAEPPKSACFVEVEKPDGSMEMKKFDGDSEKCKTKLDCPCGMDMVVKCDSTGKCKEVSTGNCMACPLGGPTLTESLSCKDACTIAACGEFSSGEPIVGMSGQCYLSKPVVNVKTGKTVIQALTSCDVLKEADLSQHSKAACTLCKQACETNKGYCGDGTLQAGEACDDGNTQFLDGCTPKCKKTKCFMGCVAKKLDPWGKYLAGVYEYAASKVKETGLVGSWKLYAEDPECKIPQAITDAKGNLILPVGAPCMDYNKSYTFKLDASATLECKKKCSPNPAEYQGCVTTCKNIPECKKANAFFDAITKDGCVLPYGVKKGDTYLCKVNAPCSCALPYVYNDCATVSNACKDDCKTKYGTPPPEGFDCKLLAETAPVYFEGELGVATEAEALKKGSLEQFKGDGATLFEKIWPQIAAWNDFYASTSHSPAEIKQAGDLALAALKNATLCEGPHAVEYADANLKEGICWQPQMTILSPDQLQQLGADRAAKIALAALGAADVGPSGVAVGDYGYQKDALDLFIQKTIQLLIPSFDTTTKPGNDKAAWCNAYLSEE